MSAVAQKNKLLASIDAVYAGAAGDSGPSFHAPSASAVAIAADAPSVRRDDPAMAQLKRLEALLVGWMSANDAWAH